MVRKSKATVLIADDHPIVLNGIQGALEGRSDLEVVGAVMDGVAAVEQVEALKPNLLLLDVSMPGMSGVEVAYKVREASPETRVLVYSMDAHRETFLSLFNAGIAGYVLKDESIETLLNALKTVAEGKVYFSSAVADVLRGFNEGRRGNGKGAEKDVDGLASLSPRERDILPFPVHGMDSEEIANHLGISSQSVESHKANMLDKLGARTVDDLPQIVNPNDWEDDS